MFNLIVHNRTEEKRAQKKKTLWLPSNVNKSQQSVEMETNFFPIKNNRATKYVFVTCDVN